MSRPPDIDVLIIGAGVVGLACGVAMARAGRGVIVAESEERAGEGVSSRNSGVIHAGLYYPTGSLKARVCVRGRELLYDFCARYGVPHQRTGKWVVAVEPAQLAELEKLVERAEANGLGRLRIVDRAELSRLEPALRAHAAIDVPQTGIVDVPLYVEALAGALQQAGGRQPGCANHPRRRLFRGRSRRQRSRVCPRGGQRRGALGAVGCPHRGRTL